MNAYQKFCKPALAKALRSVGMDKQFHRAEGAYLYYRDATGKEHRVFDCLGGYGAVLLGHNHPHLVKTANVLLQDHTAFHNQFSIRTGSAALAAELNPILKRETGWWEDFIMAFTNSGAESVEVAVKHAEFTRSKQLEVIGDELSAVGKKLKDIKSAVWDISEQDYDVLKLKKTHGHHEIMALVDEFNTGQLARPPVFVALKHAFHGKLTSTIQLTYGHMYRQPFKRFGMQVHFMTPEEIRQRMDTFLHSMQAWLYKAVIRQDRILLQRMALPIIGAILVEPVQGEGGVYCLTRDHVKILHAARDKWQCPLISDEVQSGCGRCGSFLAGSQVGLQPDYVVISKALGGGISKLGVVAVREGAYSQGFDLIQSSTFGEDDYSSLIALEYVRLLQKDNNEIYKRVRNIGNRILQKLEALKEQFSEIITDVRGKGLLLGIEFADQSNADSHMIKTIAYQGALGYLLSGLLLNEKGIRVAPPASAANVIRMEPSIDTTDDDIEGLIRALTDICSALRFQDAHFLLRFLTDEKDYGPRASKPKNYRPYYKEQRENTPANKAQGIKVTKVAFINHLISSEWLAQVDPSFAGVGAAEADNLMNRLTFDRRSAPFPPARIISLKGNAADFILYPLTMTSAQIESLLAENDLTELRNAINERIRTARDDGCSVAGLGMFTSIATNNAKAVDVSGINLTTGNSLTVAMAAQAIRKVSRDLMIKPACAAVVGASGNIGSVYSSILAEDFSKLVLVGSGRKGSVSRLTETAHRVYEDCWQDLLNDTEQSRTGIAAMLRQLEVVRKWLGEPALRAATNIGQNLRAAVMQRFGEDPFIVVSDDIRSIREADVIVCAANSSQSFISPDIIKPRALVCDIAVPHNLSQKFLDERSDIICIRGGVVSTPNNESLDPRARAYLLEGQIYACMAETIVLGLHGYTGHYSYGNLKREQVREIWAMAQEHGFGLASIKIRESL